MSSSRSLRTQNFVSELTCKTGSIPVIPHEQCTLCVRILLVALTPLYSPHTVIPLVSYSMILLISCTHCTLIPSYLLYPWLSALVPLVLFIPSYSSPPHTFTLLCTPHTPCVFIPSYPSYLWFPGTHHISFAPSTYTLVP